MGKHYNSMVRKETQNITDGHMDKVSYRADDQWFIKMREKKRLYVHCRLTDRPVERVSYILDAHWFEGSSPKKSSIYLKQELRKSCSL